jgi:hypothetical protein
METLIAIALGLALAAACGFRIFVPLLAVGLAQAGGYLTLAPKFAWIGGTPALIVLGAATVAEIAAYYVPWLDHLLDSIATPAAVVAGIVVTASVVTDVDPLWRWTLAVIAGGGLAGAVQGSSVLARAVSGAATGGLANPVVATGELFGAIALSILALLVPVLALIVVVVGILLTILWVRRRRAARRSNAAQRRTAGAQAPQVP